MNKKRMVKGHISQRGENKYLVRWRGENGKQVGKVVEGDYARALAYLAEQLNPKTTEPTRVPERTFGSFVEKEWAQYVHDHWKASTQNTLGCLVTRHIAPFFRSMNLSEIEPTHIVEFHRSMTEKKHNGKPYSRKTRRNAHAVMVCMFNLAVDLRLIGRTPVPRRSGPKHEKVEKPALSEQQASDLLRRVPVRYKAFYAVLVLTGIRCGEALGLKWADVDLADSMLHIRRAIYRGQETTPKTPAALRDRPMVTELQHALLNHKVMAVYRQPSDYVFASASGRPLNPDLLRGTLQATLKEMGVRFEQPHADGLHLLRHTSGSVLYRRSGGDLKTTQEWLGHSNSRITADVYIHSQDGQQRKAAEVLSRAVFQQPEAPTRESAN